MMDLFLPGVAISCVQCATGTETRDTSVKNVLDGIRSGDQKLKGQIQQIRNRFESGARYYWRPTEGKTRY